MKIKAFLYIIIFITLPYSCLSPQTEKHTQIRGKIVNPRTDMVIISRDFLNLNADTLPLHYENEIKGKVKCRREGLYFIAIYPEFQTIYLKPGDSLAFHINVDEFDESLSFSGSIGFENNLLIELFLQNEKESAYFYDRKFDFDTQTFLKKIDSFAQIKSNLIKSYQSELRHTGKRYRKIVNLYNQSLQYSLKEAYLRKHPDSKVQQDYENYCKILRQKLPDPNIIYMYAFADNYIERKIAQKKVHNNPVFLEIGQTINREISDPEFKDNLLVKYCQRYIKETKTSQPDTVIKYYFKTIKNSLYINYCKKLIQKNKNLADGQNFPPVVVRDRHNQRKKITKILNGHQNLISFWDLNRRKNFISNLNKLNQIHQKYPEIRIIIINTNPDAFDEWLIQTPVNSDFTYLQMTRNDEINTVKPYHLAQVFLTDSTYIKQSLINMYEPQFQKKLETFAKPK